MNKRAVRFPDTGLDAEAVLSERNRENMDEIMLDVPDRLDSV